MAARGTWHLDATSQLVARELLRRGSLSRAELARLLHLSGPTVSRVVKPLIAAGLISEAGPAMLTRTGRPSLPLRFSEDLGRFCGLGVGVDTLQVTVCTVGGAVLHEREFALESGDPTAAMATMVEGITWARQQDPRTVAVGVSFPGSSQSRV